MKRLIVLLFATLMFGTLFANNANGLKESKASADVTVNANLDAGLTAPAENQQVSVNSEKTCYAQITFSIDCGDGTEYIYVFFVSGKCTPDFYQRALKAVDTIAIECDLYEC